jgi:(p)ppGpp synthase/HD superfamily hydrolase
MPSGCQPFLTRRFELALQFASGLHHSQCRKGTPIPYISHLMAVSALVLEAGGDEDLAIAALLHDAVEDQGGAPTLQIIRRMFGDRVANVVMECSDTDREPKPPWRERKERYLTHLLSASADALLVSMADKLHNARFNSCGLPEAQRKPLDALHRRQGRAVLLLRRTCEGVYTVTPRGPAGYGVRPCGQGTERP